MKLRPFRYIFSSYSEKKPADVSTENPLSTKRGDLIKVAVIFGYVQSVHAVNISLLCYSSSCPEV